MAFGRLGETDECSMYCYIVAIRFGLENITGKCAIFYFKKLYDVRLVTSNMLDQLAFR